MALVFLLNTAITALLQLGCVAGQDIRLKGLPALVLPAAVISQAGFLNLYPAALAWLLGLGVKSQSAARWLTGVVFGVAQCAIAGDVAVFRLFGCHLLSLPMFKLLTTPGNADIFRPGQWTSVALLGAAVLVTALSLWLSLGLAARLAPAASCLPRMRYALGCLLACALVERGTFAWCSLSDPAVLNQMQGTLTFYLAFDPRPWAERLGCLPHTALPPLWETPTALHLPKHPLGPAVPARMPNVLFLLSDCVRTDALTPQSMPNVSRLADEGWRLERNFSTGNSTQPGCFGLFYGLPATYMPAVAAQKVTSPAVDFFIQQRYELCLLVAGAASVAGLQDTAFRQLRQYLTDNFKCDHVDRDRMMTEHFLRFLDQRKDRPSDRRPFFGFLFYDATHVPYDYPPEDAVLDFKAKPGEVNYVLLLAEPKASARFKNCYLNAAHYVDRQIGRVLEHLHASGEFEQTIIVVAGDHGEEFGECGHFGHLSGFNRFQTQTLAVMHVPGEPHRVFTNLTSHVDFMPTVLTWMGVTNALGDYSTGLPLQGNRQHEFVVVSDFQRNIAAVKSGSFTTFQPRGVSSQNLEEQVLSENDPGRFTPEDLTELVAQCRWFYQ